MKHIRELGDVQLPDSALISADLQAGRVPEVVGAVARELQLQ